jgi:hypothetical protein
MARIEDFLSRSEQKKLYDHIHRKVLKIPKVSKDSWDAFFLILFLILIADRKIRPAELSFFNNIINTTFNRDWDSSKILKGRMPRKEHLIKLGAEVLEIYSDLSELGSDPLVSVIRKVSDNIDSEELKRITLLASVRLAISDLEIEKNENLIIHCLSEDWNLQELLDEIKYKSLQKKGANTVAAEIIGMTQGLASYIDETGLRHSQYEEIVYLIHKKGLKIPGDELIFEEFELYIKKTDKQQKKSIEKINKEHEKLIKRRQNKHQVDMRVLKRKISNKQQKYGPAFICSTFLNKLNFHKNSFDLISDNFESSHIWIILLKLNNGELFSENIIKSKRIKGKKGWMEIARISTGNNPMGRIYYCSSAEKSKRFNVFVDFKNDEKTQKKVFLLLDKWVAAGFK